MPDFQFSPPEQTIVPIFKSDKWFAVRRVYCVGRNYAAHIKEMGGDDRQPPIFFQKPTDSVVINNTDVPYPPLTSDLHYEIELVMAIGRGGKNISKQDAAAHVFGLGVGIDLTRRDLQSKVRQAGGPWEIAKAFDHSAPLAAIVPVVDNLLPTSGRIALSVNGTVKQSADLGEMIWSCAEIVAELSTHNTLATGDLIFTGTPSGVGPIVPGDRLHGEIDGLPPLDFQII